jgi:hypothetical protein
MKKKWVGIGCILIVILFGLLIWENRTVTKPSLYDETEETEAVAIRIEVMEDQILYVLYNQTEEEIFFEPRDCCIERFDGHGWNEVVTRTGKRATERSGARTDVLNTLLPNGDENCFRLGTIKFNELSHLSSGEYRVVIPVLNERGQVIEIIASEHFVL